MFDTPPGNPIISSSSSSSSSGPAIDITDDVMDALNNIGFETDSETESDIDDYAELKRYKNSVDYMYDSLLRSMEILKRIKMKAKERNQIDKVFETLQTC